MLAIGMISLFASTGARISSAANVRQTIDAKTLTNGAVTGERIAPAGVRAAHRTAIARITPANTACTIVPISTNVQADLEEPAAFATAEMVISTPGTYTGMNVDGTGCDIALYIAQGTKDVRVTDSVIHDGTRAGIVADTTHDTKLTNDVIYNIGDHNGTLFAPDGVQYGFGVLVESVKDALVSGISSSQYQKEGFLIINSTGSVTYNMATGSGILQYIASNGFEIDGSKLESIAENRTELNQYYYSTYGAAGYIICGTSVENHLLDSQSQSHFAKNWENLSAFDDIPYYFSKHADCS